MVAMPDALDQYFIENPRELVGRPCERLIVDPDNELVDKLANTAARTQKDQ